MPDQSILFQTILNNSLDAIVFVDGHCRVKIWNLAAEKLLGISSDRAIDCDFFDLVFPVGQRETERKAYAAVRVGDENPLSIKTMQSPDCSEFQVDQVIHRFHKADEIWGYIEIRDAKPRVLREGQLERAATTDELSQLLNRRGFQQQLESHLDRPLTLGFCDIDRFKKINDELGHKAGDEAIQSFSRVLEQSFPEAICVARLGGDEFGVILETGDPESMAVPFEALRAKTETSTHGENGLRMSVSIGVAVSQQPNVPARELLTHADQAMYRSKHAGRNRVTWVTVDAG